MYIEVLGLSGARIQAGDKTILLSPARRMKADIAVLGKPGDKINVEPNAASEQLFVIQSPGEYEARGVFFYCLPNPPAGEIKSLLTSLTLEDITVTHLAGLERELTPAELELFEGTDVLLVPVGGGEVLSAKAASELVSALEPRIVIPMHGDAAAFLKIMGAKTEPQEKVRITKKDLPQEDMNIIYLQP